ncbi:guanylate kinase [Haloechinothrix sp. LS1_15]|uniref:guanylate kinase n=1 Tax=Haloechinothrix sp. LS1_15 TaxID=2652248 RepID=UPI002946DA56|nr:guanylate kinase [Haloechinothrix sp. LS1_15]MDV6013267.1 guanylate kinase [Haloechinothrix sp. LS1_15]
MTAANPSGGEPGAGPRARPRLTVVSGPSGVGKSSVLAELRTLVPDVYFSVSVTTRAARPGEVDGEHYHFVDRETFEAMAARGELLEYAEFAGNLYGTPRGPVTEALAAGRPAVLEIEIQGARQVRRAMPEAQLVMLVPPSWEELVGRLTGRGTEEGTAVRTRLSVAAEELAAAEEFDAHVVNTDVRTAAEQLLTLISGKTVS